MLAPCCDVPSSPISLRLQQIEIGCETKTKDNVFTHIKVSIQFQISTVDQQAAIWKAYYRLTNARRQIESYVYDVVRSTVPKMNLDDVFTTKEEVSHAISSSLKEVRERESSAPLPSDVPLCRFLSPSFSPPPSLAYTYMHRDTFLTSLFPPPP